MASGCFKPLQLGDWSTLSNYTSSCFFYLLYFFTLWVLFEYLSEKLGTLENGEAIGLQGEGPCTRSSTDCPCVQHVRGRSTRLTRHGLDISRHGLDRATWVVQSLCFRSGLDVPWPTRNVPMQWITCQWHVRLCQTCSFPAQASLTLKWVCAPEVSVGKARCNIPRQGPAKAICIEHVGTMKIQY